MGPETPESTSGSGAELLVDTVMRAGAEELGPQAAGSGGRAFETQAAADWMEPRPSAPNANET